MQRHGEGQSASLQKEHCQQACSIQIKFGYQTYAEAGAMLGALGGLGVNIAGEHEKGGKEGFQYEAGKRNCKNK